MALVLLTLGVGPSSRLLKGGALVFSWSALRFTWDISSLSLAISLCHVAAHEAATPAKQNAV